MSFVEPSEPGRPESISSNERILAARGRLELAENALYVSSSRFVLEPSHTTLEAMKTDQEYYVPYFCQLSWEELEAGASITDMLLVARERGKIRHDIILASLHWRNISFRPKAFRRSTIEKALTGYAEISSGQLKAAIDQEVDSDETRWPNMRLRDYQRADMLRLMSVQVTQDLPQETSILASAIEYNALRV